MVKQKRGPLSHQVESKAEEIATKELTHHSWRRHIAKGAAIGTIFYLIQLFIVLIYLYITSNLFILLIFNSIIFIEAALYFLLSGIAIFFEPSPSWNAFKSTLMNHPLTVKTTTEALRNGAGRFTTATLLLIFLELQGAIFREIF